MNDIQSTIKKLELLNKRDYIIVTNLIDTLLESEIAPNQKTLESISEVEEMEKNPHLYKSYSCFAEILEEVQSEI